MLGVGTAYGFLTGWLLTFLQFTPVRRVIFTEFSYVAFFFIVKLVFALDEKDDTTSGFKYSEFFDVILFWSELYTLFLALRYYFCRLIVPA